MKLSAELLKSIALGIAVSSFAYSCRRDDVKSGTSGKDHSKKNEKRELKGQDYCPTCGMG